MLSSISFKSLLVGSVLIAILLSGCASIVGKAGAEVLSLKSTPDQASIIIEDETGTKVFEGKTPTNVPLEKKKGFFSGKSYSVKISKPGFADRIVNVGTNVNGWYIGGNLIFGGLIGWLIVDPATGAMWTLNTNDINVTLEPSKQSINSNDGSQRIMLLSDVPTPLLSKLIKISD
jgi:hypothetical protein